MNHAKKHHADKRDYYKSLSESEKDESQRDAELREKLQACEAEYRAKEQKL